MFWISTHIHNWGSVSIIGRPNWRGIKPATNENSGTPEQKNSHVEENVLVPLPVTDSDPLTVVNLATVVIMRPLTHTDDLKVVVWILCIAERNEIQTVFERFTLFWKKTISRKLSNLSVVSLHIKIIPFIIPILVPFGFFNGDRIISAKRSIPGNWHWGVIFRNDVIFFRFLSNKFWG